VCRGAGGGSASPPQSPGTWCGRRQPRTAWRRASPADSPRDDFLASRPPSEGGGQVGSQRCPQAFLIPCVDGAGASRPGWLYAREGVGPLSFVLNKDPSLAPCSTHPLSVASLQHLDSLCRLRASCQTPQSKGLWPPRKKVR